MEKENKKIPIYQKYFSLLLLSALLADILYANQITEALMTIGGVIYFLSHAALTILLVVITVCLFAFKERVEKAKLRPSFASIDRELAEGMKSMCDFADAIRKRKIFYNIVSWSLVFGLFYTNRNVLGTLGLINLIFMWMVKGFAISFQGDLKEYLQGLADNRKIIICKRGRVDNASDF